MAKFVLPQALGKAAATLFRQPTIIPCHRGRDTQRQALLPEQRIAPVPTAVGPDGTLLGEVDDVLDIFIAWPGDIRLAGRERHTNRVHTGDKIAIVT
jgi:hypothetical protein